MKIFINPGHSIDGFPTGKIDSGACGNGLKEAQIALDIGNKVVPILRANGFIIKLQQLDGIANIYHASNNWGADLFVSIHCNSASPAASGSETFYCLGSKNGKKLAHCIQSRLVKILGTVDRGVKDDTQSAVGRLGVLRNTCCTAALVETAFISNASDAKLLRERQDDFAKAIAFGICDYCGVPVKQDQLIVQVVEKEVAPSKNVDIDKIACLARKYESDNDPACVYFNKGDLGGVSYGTYQFASNVGVVDNFVDWLCKYNDDKLANYGRVLAAHSTDSADFVKQWQELGTIDPGNFGKLQDEFVKEMYYDKVADKLAKENFHLDKHSDAFKAVVFARAIQNGVSGCVNLLYQACDYPNLSYVDDSYFDGDLISDIYDFLIIECDSAKPDSQGVWRSPYNFVHSSQSIVAALRNRFINERKDALAMLTGKTI